jgi:hypothetical protein
VSTRLLATTFTQRSYSLEREGEYLPFYVQTSPCAPLADAHRWLLVTFLRAFGSLERYYLIHGVPHIISAPPPISVCIYIGLALLSRAVFRPATKGVPAGGANPQTPFVAGCSKARDKRARQKARTAPKGFGATWPGHLSRIEGRTRQKAPTKALFSTSVWLSEE